MLLIKSKYSKTDKQASLFLHFFGKTFGQFENCLYLCTRKSEATQCATRLGGVAQLVRAHDS